MNDLHYVNIHRVARLYFIIDKANAYSKERNGNKSMTLVSNDKNKETLKKYTELWNKIKNLTETLNNKPSEYGKEFMKIIFSSDNNLPLGNILSLKTRK